jgi:hypothetical protein
MISLTLRIEKYSKTILIRWCQDNSYHRVDGPAYVWVFKNGKKEFYSSVNRRQGKGWQRVD